MPMVHLNTYKINSYPAFKSQENTDDKVAYIAAGGTINTIKKDGENVGSNTAIKKMFDELRSKTGKQYSVFSSPLDSSNYTPSLQQKLSSVISNIVHGQIEALTGKKRQYLDDFDSHSKWVEYKKSLKPTGDIITHGTDTLEENAALLAYENLQAPIIYTASWLGPMEKGSDAIPNLMKAQKLASNKNTPPGVFVVIGDEIHLATRLHKVNTKPWLNSEDPEQRANSYFASVDGSPVGKFDSRGNITFTPDFLDSWKKIHADNPLKKYGINIKDGIKPAYVEHVIIDENSDVSVFKDLAQRLTNLKEGERKGALIEGTIPDNPKITQIISELNSNPNICVINSEDVKGLYPVQSRIKLAVLLGIKEIPKEDILGLMKTSISGEIVTKDGIEHTQWQLPKEFCERAEFIVAFPGMERSIIDSAVTRLLQKPSQKEKILLINGFGDGHIPIGYMSIQERIRGGFGKIGKSHLADKILDSIDRESIFGEDNFSIQNIIKHTQKVLSEESITDPKAHAKELLKEAFVQTNELLQAIDDAQRKGIKVKIGAKPDYAVTNLHAYEIGNILELVGAQGISMPTHDYIESFSTQP